MLEKIQYISGDRIEREIHIHHGSSENMVVYDSDNPSGDWSKYKEKEKEPIYEWFPD